MNELCVDSRIARWKRRSASTEAAVLPTEFSISLNAFSISATSSVVARSAAIRAEAGSMTSRSSSRSMIAFGKLPPENCQASTSGSSAFQSFFGRMRVPVFRRTSTSPLDVRTLIASRIAVLLTLRETPNAASVGRISPGRILPLKMLTPKCSAIRPCRLVLLPIALTRIFFPMELVTVLIIEDRNALWNAKLELAYGQTGPVPDFHLLPQQNPRMLAGGGRAAALFSSLSAFCASDDLNARSARLLHVRHSAEHEAWGQRSNH